MFALLTALVFAQSSATITIGGKAKPPDSATIKTRDSLRVRRELLRDSVNAFRRANDSTETARRPWKPFRQ